MGKENLKHYEILATAECNDQYKGEHFYTRREFKLVRYRKKKDYPWSGKQPMVYEIQLTPLRPCGAVLNVIDPPETIVVRKFYDYEEEDPYVYNYAMEIFDYITKII